MAVAFRKLDSDTMAHIATLPTEQRYRASAALIEEMRAHTRFEWVPTEKMVVPAYGRPLSQSKVNHLRAHWDIRAVGTLYLAYRSDEDLYGLLDGHHRKVSAEQEGFQWLPSFIYEGLSYAEEANLYRLFATVNRQTALDRFRAALEAGDERAQDIQLIVEEVANMELPTQRTGPGHINAIHTLELIYSSFGRDVLVETCQIIRAAWRDHSRAWTDRVLMGVAMFIMRYAKHPNLQEERLVTRLSLTTPEMLLAKANMVSASVRKSEMRAAVGIAIVEVYNDGIRAKLPPWATRVYGPNTREQVAETARKNLRSARKLVPA